MLAFGFGNPADWAIIFIVALIVFGPKKLPELGQQLGQALREFRKIADDVTGATDSVRSEVAGVASTFRRQVDEVRTAAVIDAKPLLAERNERIEASEPAPPGQSSASGGTEPNRPRGLRVSTAVPEATRGGGDEKG